MRRKAYDDMVRWKNKSDRRALLLTGCRQTGKTYLMKKFAKENYKHHLYCDLEEQRNLHDIFENSNLSAVEIIERLAFLTNFKLVPGETVILLDEIQACIPAYSALRNLSDQEDYDVIASGSLLGVKIEDLQRRTPMGYVEYLRILPMDFEEFLWAMKIPEEHIGYLRGCIQNLKPIDKGICMKYNDLYRKYIVVGGMPQSVKEFVDSHIYANSKKVLKDIVKVVGDDFEKYSNGKERIIAEYCLKSIPSQLAMENKKFKYARISKRKGGSRFYGSYLLWLLRAGLIEYCYNLEQPVAPLSPRIRPESFKIFMSDTGLMMTLMEDGSVENIVYKDPFANNGAVMENAVACALVANGYDIHFYERKDSSLEVDFTINMGGKVVVIEVKSGRDKRAKSLNTLVKERSVDRAIKISDGNVFMDENGIENYPLFGPCFFAKSDSFDDFEEPDLEELLKMTEEVLRSMDDEKKNGETV